jgi:magnesium-transporting ATPase (P-type)
MGKLAEKATILFSRPHPQESKDYFEHVTNTYKKIDRELKANTPSSRALIETDMGQVKARLKESLLRERVKKRLDDIDRVTANDDRAGGNALVIDGPCLRACMQEAVKIKFLHVGVRCKSVICCRVTPSQKAQVTLLVKENMPGQITLAIGDGANDVSMIQVSINLCLASHANALPLKKTHTHTQ